MQRHQAAEPGAWQRGAAQVDGGAPTDARGGAPKAGEDARAVGGRGLPHVIESRPLHGMASVMGVSWCKASRRAGKIAKA